MAGKRVDDGEARHDGCFRKPRRWASKARSRWPIPDRLRQGLRNLVENAIRHTDPGGTIKVSETRTPAAVGRTMDATSPGVPDNKLPRLFERFFRVDTSRNRQTGGSGLGLAICRAIVEAHEGTISVAASPLGGLAVTVTLQVAQEPGR